MLVVQKIFERIVDPITDATLNNSIEDILAVDVEALMHKIKSDTLGNFLHQIFASGNLPALKTFLSKNIITAEILYNFEGGLNDIYDDAEEDNRVNEIEKMIQYLFDEGYYDHYTFKESENDNLPFYVFIYPLVKKRQEYFAAIYQVINLYIISDLTSLIMSF